MSATDDLLNERRCLLEFGLPLFMDFWPDRIPMTAPHMLTSYLGTLLSRLARCYWVGLAEEARPRLEQMIGWMERQDPAEFSYRGETHRRTELVVPESQVSWWETLGLCKWLARDEDSSEELGKALFATWDLWQLLRPEKHAPELGSRQAFMSRTLALALAAKRPEFGAHMYDLVEDWDPRDRDRFKTRFGHWACVHLAHGGARDGDYVRTGIDALRECATEPRAWGPSDEYLFWLKAVWFDTGLATTAEQAVAREYDVENGRRPGFLPKRESFL